MAAGIVLSGANIILWVNNVQYKEVQTLTFSVDYGEEPIYGIDSPMPQEIAGTRLTIKGNVSGIRIKNSGGIQAKNLRPLFTDLGASPYVSIRIQDRQSQEDILFIPQAKVVRENHTAATKSSYKLNFDFVGMMALWALDRS
jgi:hypothetical protein